MHQLKRLVAVCALMFAPDANAEAPALPFAWQKVTEFYVTSSPSRIYGPDNAVYIQTRLPSGNLGPQETGVWHTIDLGPFGVAPDATAAFLSGMLVITGGTTAEVADIQVGFRRPGDTTPCSKYLGQTVYQTNVVYGQTIGGGQRSNMATWVPLSNSKFEFCYQLSTLGSWPGNPSYAINLSLQAWAR